MERTYWELIVDEVED
jgi:hypothetical protein